MEKNVVQMCLQGSLDDLLPNLLAEDRDRTVQFHEDFHRGIKITAAQLEAFVKDARVQVDKSIGQNAAFLESTDRETKKMFAQMVKDSVMTGKRPGMCFQIWDGKDPLAVVENTIKSSCSSGSLVDNVRDLFGGISWTNYGGSEVVVEE